MAQLKDTTVNGNLEVTGSTIFGNITNWKNKGSNNCKAVYFDSNGAPQAFTCPFGSAAWLSCDTFAKKQHTHPADCITGGRNNQVLTWSGGKSIWKTPSAIDLSPYAKCYNGCSCCVEYSSQSDITHLVYYNTCYSYDTCYIGRGWVWYMVPWRDILIINGVAQIYNAGEMVCSGIYSSNPNPGGRSCYIFKYISLRDNVISEK